MPHADALLQSMMHPHTSAWVWMRGLISLCLLVGLSCTHAADPEAYPNKPLRMIVPFPPGGPVDTVARVVGQRLSTTFGQAVKIDNLLVRAALSVQRSPRVHRLMVTQSLYVLFITACYLPSTRSCPMIFGVTLCR